MVEWDCCLQNDWKGKARMICMGRAGDGSRSMDYEMVDASDGDVGGDA
jgi:hypothetical protein